MIKKEINEIKGLFNTLDDCGITRLVGCYVDGEKQKIAKFNEIFLNLPDEETYKYLDIFHKTLSGTPGKNLLDMEFKPEGDGRKLLLAVKESQLKDDNILDAFYDQVVKTYGYVGNYLILLVYQSYDVPCITTDGLGIDDASDEVYSYILCSICPVDLTKPALGFEEDAKEFHNLKQFFTVGAPSVGFLFPAFTDRSSDDSRLLYYTKKNDDTQHTLIDDLLQCATPMPAKRQKESFNELVTDVLGEESDLDTVKNIQNELKTFVQEKKKDQENGVSEDQGPVTINAQEAKNILEKSGVSQEKLEDFDQKYEHVFGKLVDAETGEIIDEEPEPEEEGYVPEAEKAAREAEKTSYAYDDRRIYAENLIPAKNMEVKTADVVVRINSDKTDLVETRVIDGKKCLVIELGDGLVVNGIPIKKN